MYKTAYLASKRFLDLLLSTGALFLTSPAFLAIAIAIKREDGGPIFFTQLRAGQHGQSFRIIKFRTMAGYSGDEVVLDTASWTNGVPDTFVFKTAESKKSDVTRIGRLLRRTSLDELPQLLNVICGHMSLVGPRPEILPVAHRYNAEQSVRLTVKPGLTGWAQVTGRSAHDHGQKIAADAYYVANASLAFDLRILVRTVIVAVRAKEAF